MSKKKKGSDTRERASKKVFRGGHVHVKAEQCETCIFRPGGFNLTPRRFKQMVDGAKKSDSCIVCHDTLYNGAPAVCRGFFDKVNTTPLILARAFNVIVEV